MFGLVLAIACNKKNNGDPTPDPDSEVVTTMQLSAINVADTSDKPTAQWRDTTPNDGDPDLTKAHLVLRKNAVYTVSLTMLDETQNPIHEVSAIIQRTRANYHLICYARSSALDLTILRTDHDNNSPQLELGLASKFTTGAVSSGELQVTLHHQVGTKNGTDCSLGLKDAEANFTVSVQ